MPRQAYVNGRFVPHSDAEVSIDDRGYLFSDGVYDVLPVVDGKLIDEELHLNRLERSLKELRIAMPRKRAVLSSIARELIGRNLLTYGFLYMQVTRGVAPRDHKFPVGVRPSIVMTTKALKAPSAEILDKGVAVVTVPDERWKRRDIKSISLLPNCLAKQAAAEQGAIEAWMVDDKGFVTEGSSTTAWIVTKDGAIITRALSHDILPGVTRQVLTGLIRGEKLRLEERAFTPEEAYNAKEAFITSATNFVMPVTSIDGKSIGNGRAGEVASHLRQAFFAAVT